MTDGVPSWYRTKSASGSGAERVSGGKRGEDRGRDQARDVNVEDSLRQLYRHAIEFYDFYIYGLAAALVFPALFFPELNPTSGLLASFATYGVAFLARPLGGAIFGHFGDRVGRKVMLIVSLLLMGISTFLVGLLPGYATIGILAPILLVVLRFLQGIGLGGEWGGAVLMTAEHVPSGKRAFYSGFPQVGPALGYLRARRICGCSLLTDLYHAVRSDEH